MDIFYSKEKKGLLVLQPFVAAGSLKDRIHRVNPTRSYKEKYRLVGASPLPFNDIARFGRQILEALVALRSKGIVCEHLSSGNVIIDQENARIADIYTPLLAIDRYKDVRELTVPLEGKVELDLLLLGRLVYEMATGMELTTVQPEEGVLELLAPEIAHVLEMIFFPTYINRAPSSSDSDFMSSGNVDADDDCESVASVDTTATTSSSKKNSYGITIDAILSCELFANAEVPPIETLFSGFRFDSSMKSTIKSSMRINASRNQAYVVHFNEKEALQRARQRAERRVYEEKEKQQQRIQQLTTNKNQPAKNLNFNSKTTLTRRKSYRADSMRAGLPHRQLSRTNSSSSNQKDASASTSSA
jgi:serine/threonine protein kinase